MVDSPVPAPKKPTKSKAVAVPAPKAAKTAAAPAKRGPGRPAKVLALTGPGSEAPKKAEKAVKTKQLLMNLPRLLPVPSDVLDTVNKLVHQSGVVAAVTTKFLTYIHFHVAETLESQVSSNSSDTATKLFEFPANVGRGNSADRIIARWAILNWFTGLDATVYLPAADFDSARKIVQGLCGLDIRIPRGTPMPAVQLSADEHRGLGNVIAFSAAFDEGGYSPATKDLATFKDLELAGYVVVQDFGFRVTDAGVRVFKSIKPDDLARAQAEFRDTIKNGPLSTVLSFDEPQPAAPGVGVLNVSDSTSLSVGDIGVVTTGATNMESLPVGTAVSHTSSDDLVVLDEPDLDLRPSSDVD